MAETPNTGEANYNLYKPFGPTMMRIELPSVIYDSLLQITDDILKDENRQSWGPNLAGQIKEEPYIPHSVLEENDLRRFFEDVCKGYVKMVYSNSPLPKKKYNDPTIELKDFWVVSQYKNEYNPAHYHTNCTISGVLYLKVPPIEQRVIYGKDQITDGCIEWIYNAPHPGTMDFGAHRQFPKEGDLWLWPSKLPHVVYPFCDDGERRSIAFNAAHRFLDENGEEWHG